MSDPNKLTFASWLVEFLNSRNLGLNHFAKETGLSNATVSKVRSGEHVPGPYTIKKIAARWGQDEDWLLTLAGHRTLLQPREETLDDPELLVLLSPTNLNKMTNREKKMVKDLIRNILEGKE